MFFEAHFPSSIQGTSSGTMEKQEEKKVKNPKKKEKKRRKKKVDMFCRIRGWLVHEENITSSNEKGQVGI
jgi:malate synthase